MAFWHDLAAPVIVSVILASMIVNWLNKRNGDAANLLI
ncbi:type I toxin-antitoxin system toxin Ldr family protein [Escherichia coli]|nr:type I toxin-antitoxin system toxin Ldr family protein [Escherichia coli]MDM4920346.1 type I toxin-antitoxin system toxin Ldr family protein [Escherichia coli]